MDNDNFLSQISIDYGPVNVLGRFFLMANEALSKAGINLRIEPISELARINRDNRDSWPPLYPGLSVEFNNLDEEATLCFIGRNKDGVPLVAQGTRLYDFTDTNFTAEAESMRAFYEQPGSFVSKGEKCTVSAMIGQSLTGPVAYSGATWVHPSCRGYKLIRYLPRISRAATIAKWGAPVVFGLMDQKLVRSGLLTHNGFANLEWAADFSSPSVGTYRLAVLWMKLNETVEDLADMLSSVPVADVAKLETPRSA